MRWVIFDGDVDALWVENMNSGTHIYTHIHIYTIINAFTKYVHRYKDIDTCRFESTLYHPLSLRSLTISSFSHFSLISYLILLCSLTIVMDDNKLLTLPNGERIRLQSHCALICETFDLQYASPATISRCGMVWVDPQVSDPSFSLRLELNDWFFVISFIFFNF